MSPELKEIEGEDTQKKSAQEQINGFERDKAISEFMNRLNHNLAESLILDLGCGRGVISLPLSKQVKWVIGVDSDKETIRATHSKTQKLNRDNFFTILGSATNIPVKSDYVDFALIIGVLEWVPRSKPYEDPESTQIEALREVGRILRRRGRLLLAIENRYYLRYWLGLTDHHSRLKFVPVLPRKIADFISRRRKGEPYLNRTYSYFELKNLLRKAGFRTLKICLGIPDYVFAEEIVDIDDKDEINEKINSVRQSKSRKIAWRTINRLGLMKFLCSNFIVACQK
ncbi:MAG: class I SAM-dependent methyltransferase [Candidatus Bathyarchaeia archaeon]